MKKIVVGSGKTGPSSFVCGRSNQPHISSILDVEPTRPLLVIKQNYSSKTDRVLEMAVTHTLAETYQIESKLIRNSPKPVPKNLSQEINYDTIS